MVVAVLSEEESIVGLHNAPAEKARPRGLACDHVQGFGFRGSRGQLGAPSRAAHPRPRHSGRRFTFLVGMNRRADEEGRQEGENVRLQEGHE
jgi:hypothetical protein